VEVIATKYESVSGATSLVGDGDTFHLGSLIANVRHTPCHTKGHIIFHIDSVGLFVGDTLFSGGCGRFFEGTAAEMLSNLRMLGTYPESCAVYCAHEYTESNFRFLASVDPQRCLSKYDAVKKMRQAGTPTVPTTVGEELKTNLFMRCDDPSLQKALSCADAVTTMAKLREMKNKFT
jgi:hydroxyacylglutathione hydrolase